MLPQEPNAVLSVFNFPENVRTPCEQYLLYFAQFLKELGIDATTDIRHEAGNVLFSVTPTAGYSALIQIREALEIYLQIPTILPTNNYMQIPNDPSSQQLLANVQHLQGQLMLSHAIAQARQETINQQEVIIRQQQQIIDGTILQHSLLTIRHSGNDEKEKLLGGTMSLTTYKGNGYELNLPTIYRWLRDKIKKG